MEGSSNCPECRLQILHNQNQMPNVVEEEYSEFQLPSSRSFLVGESNKKDGFPSSSQSTSSMAMGAFKNCHQPQAQGYQAEQLINNVNNSNNPLSSSSLSQSDPSNLQLLMNLRNSPIHNSAAMDSLPQPYPTTTNAFSLSLNINAKQGPSSSTSSTITMNPPGIGSTPETLNNSSHSNSSICCPKYCATCAVLDLPTNEKFYRPSLPRPSVYPLFYGQGPLPGFSPISEWGNCTSADFTPYTYTPFQHQQNQNDFFQPSTNVLLENQLIPKSNSSLQSCAFPSFSPGSSSSMLLMTNPPSPQLPRPQRPTNPNNNMTTAKDHRDKSNVHCSETYSEKGGERFLNIQTIQHRNFSSVSNELTSLIQDDLGKEGRRNSTIDVQESNIQNDSQINDRRSERLIEQIELIEVENIEQNKKVQLGKIPRANDFDKLKSNKGQLDLVENIDLESDNANHHLPNNEKRKKILSICLSSSDSDEGCQSHDSDSEAESYISHKDDVVVEDNEEDEEEGEETCNQCKIDERLEGPHKCIICWDSVYPEDCPSPPQLVNILENIHEDITAEDLDITVSSGDIEIGGIEDEVRDFQHKKSFCRATMAVARFAFLFGISTKDVLNLIKNNEGEGIEEKRKNKESVYFCPRCGKLALLMDTLEKQMSSTAFLLNTLLHPSYNNFEKKGFPLPVLRPENHPTSFNAETEVETEILNSLSSIPENSKLTEEITVIDKSKDSKSTQTQTQYTNAQFKEGELINSLSPVIPEFQTVSTSTKSLEDLEISKSFENGKIDLANNKELETNDNIDSHIKSSNELLENGDSSFEHKAEERKETNEIPVLSPASSSSSSDSSIVKNERKLLGSSKENDNQLECIFLPSFSNSYSPGPLQNCQNPNVSLESEEETGQSSERLKLQLKKIGEKTEIIDGKRFYLCDECGKALCSKRTLGNHLRRHANQLKIKCLTCMKGFPSKNSLIVHMRSHNGEKPYSCPHCTKTFTTKSNMSAHTEICKEKNEERESSTSLGTSLCPQDVKISEGDGRSNGRFSCDKCGLSFRQKMRYDKHLEKGCRPHLLICSICNKRFWKESEIRSHLRTHEGLKPFPCPQCGTSFSTKGNLSSHLRTHSDIKRFKCTICSKGFNRKFALQLHMNRHNGVKPFSCDICTKCFFDPSNLLNHKKIHRRKMDNNETL